MPGNWYLVTGNQAKANLHETIALILHTFP